MCGQQDTCLWQQPASYLGAPRLSAHRDLASSSTGTDTLPVIPEPVNRWGGRGVFGDYKWGKELIENYFRRENYLFMVHQQEHFQDCFTQLFSDFSETHKSFIAICWKFNLFFAVQDTVTSNKYEYSHPHTWGEVCGLCNFPSPSR
jgi:hypothetical protein